MPSLKATTSFSCCLWRFQTRGSAASVTLRPEPAQFHLLVGVPSLGTNAWFLTRTQQERLCFTNCTLDTVIWFRTEETRPKRIRLPL